MVTFVVLISVLVIILFKKNFSCLFLSFTQKLLFSLFRIYQMNYFIIQKAMINKEIDCKTSVGITQIPLTQLKQKLLGNWSELLSFHKM